MEDYRLVGRCIHAVTSEYGFKLAVGVNTVLHALTAGKVKRGKVILPSEADYGVAQLVILIVSVKRYHRSARIGTIIAEESVPL